MSDQFAISMIHEKVDRILNQREDLLNVIQDSDIDRFVDDLVFENIRNKIDKL